MEGLKRAGPSGGHLQRDSRSPRPKPSLARSRPGPTATSGSPRRRQQDRPDQPDRRTPSPSSPSPRPTAAPAGSRPGPTATSGSPRRTATRSAEINPTTARITEFPIPTGSDSVPMGSRPGPTATSGSPSTSATRSGGSTRRPTPSPSSPSPRPAAVPTGSRPAPTATSGSPRRRQQDRARSTRRRTRSPSSPSPTVGSQPLGITAGPDGNLWFTEERRQPDRPDQPDDARHHRVPDPHRQEPIPGRDHGRARRQPLVHRERPATRSAGSPRRPGPSPSSPSPPTGAIPVGITAGPDGNLWFTERWQPDRPDRNGHPGTTTQLVAQPNPSEPGQTVTFTATVIPGRDRHAHGLRRLCHRRWRADRQPAFSLRARRAPRLPSPSR